MISPASANDHATIVRLLEAADLQTSDLTGAMLENFLVERDDNGITGAVGLEISGEVALLRSLVVAPDRRKQGAGAALTAAAEQLATKRGVRRLFLLTTTATDFFAARGYRAVGRGEAPAPIRSTAQFSALCPASSSFMAKFL